MSARKDRLKKLKTLVTGLSDRDIQLKNDSKLFKNFFDNFPIPVTMWSIDKCGKVLSKKGNTIIEESADNLENLFHQEYSDDFINAHRKALSGEKMGFFSNVQTGTYYTRLVPNFSEKGEIISVTGVSWDITNNFQTLKSLESLKAILESRPSSHEEMLDIVTRAINDSRIKKLLEGGN